MIDKQRRAYIFGMALLFCASVAVIVGLGFYLFDAADVPSAADERSLVAAECQTWKAVASQVGGITVVQRGPYAVASTNIDQDNLGLYRKVDGRWIRLVPRVWLYQRDKLAFVKAGAPPLIANALANGLARQYHQRNRSVYLPRCS